MPSMFRPQGTCGAGMRVPMAVVAEAGDMEAKDGEEEDRGKKSKPTYGRTNHPPTLQPADCCPGHEKPYL